MPAGYEVRLDADVDFDVDDLRSLFEDRASARPPERRRPVASAIVPTKTEARRAPPDYVGGRASFDFDSIAGFALPQVSADAEAVRRAVRTTVPFIIADVLALACAGAFAHAALWMLGGHPAVAAAWAFPLALVPILIAYWVAGLYSEIWVHPVIELRQVVQLTSICTLAAAAGGWVALPARWDAGLPLWCAAAWVAALFFVPFGRAVLRQVCAGRASWGYPTLVIGSGGGAAQLAESLLASPKSGLRPVLMTDPQFTCRAASLPVVNDPDTLRSLLRAEGIRHAVVSLPEFGAADLAGTLDRYSGVIPHLLVLSDASTLPALWSASRTLGRLSGVEVRNGLLLATLRAGKRVVDVTVSLAVLTLTAPLLLAIAVATKLSNRGPVFFGHTRIGQHGRQFKVWKVRTMRMDAQSVLAAHLAANPAARAEWENSFKLRDDPRVTRLGRFLRRTSLDELPQLWNVLRGEMSLVGPRPIVNDEVWRYGEVIRLYASVKPGVTGLWQASGRTEVGYHARVLLDQFYVRHWSPWLDAFVLAKTVIALLRRDGAY